MSEPISIIGVGGLLTSGKDAFADYLVAAHRYEKLFMSYPLHQWLLTENPWIKLDQRILCLENWYWEPGEFHTYAEIVHQVGYTEAKEQAEVRIALQRIGTDCGRTLIGEHVWVEAMRRAVQQKLEQGSTRIVITGIRYENELMMVRSLGGETVWVERPSARAAHLEKIRSADSRATHTSEGSLDAERFDSVLMNDGDLKQLYDRSRQWIETHRTGF